MDSPYGSTLAQMSVQSPEQVLKIFQTNSTGLTQEQVDERRNRFGANKIPIKEVGLIGLFFQKCNDPFVYLLSVAAVLSFFIGEKTNAILILFFVLINIVFSFYQEARAYRALEFLKKKLTSTCKVIRDNHIVILDKSLLVPGDIVLFDAGTVVPADIRIIQDYNVVVDESILTGESMNINKTSAAITQESSEIFDMSNMLFAGSHVMGGDGMGVVVSTGVATQIGAIAQVVSHIRPTSNYIKQVKQFSKMIVSTTLISIPIIMLGHYRLNPATGIGDLIVFAIALIVSIIPATLPAVVAFSLGTAALRLARHNIIVKRLVSIEDLGDLEVLCVDKTGTLTENRMVLDRIISNDPDAMLLFGMLSTTSEGLKTGFDSAIVEKASDEIIAKSKMYEHVSEVPFDSVRMRNSVLVKDKDGNLFIITRGAPELIFELSTEYDQSKESIKDAFEKEGHEGKRVLAIATKQLTGRHRISVDDETDMKFIGFLSFIDPVKKSVKETLENAQKFGLKIKILTGDTPEVASFVAKQVGLIDSDSQVVNARMLDNLSDETFERICNDKTVFARITPGMKLSIVVALQKQYSVGFLGDGINDTPALKAAHVGIAVQEAVDVAREAADIIALEKNLSLIIFAIKEGRKIFANIDTYVKTTLSSSIGNYYSLGLLSLVLPFLPILSIQILLVNLLSDFPLLTISTDNVLPNDLKEPKRYQLNKGFPLIILLAFAGLFSDFALFGIYRSLPHETIRTLWFILSVLTEIALIFIIRNRRFLFSKPYPSFPLCTASALIVVMTIALPFTSIGRRSFALVTPTSGQWMIIIGLLALFLILSETVKLLYYKKIARV